MTLSPEQSGAESRTDEPPKQRKVERPERPLKFFDKLLIVIVSLLGAFVLRLYKMTMRFEIRGEENVAAFWRKGENVIVAFWHDRLLMLPFVYRGPKGMRALISSSKDGELIARTIRKIGLGTVRGSSTRGGRAARKEMHESLAEGYDVGITPDGPKGPRHKVKAGVVELARESGRPVLPLLYSSVRGRRVGSWDRFMVPMPFDRVIVRWGEPVWMQPDEPFENDVARVEAALCALRQLVDSETGNVDPADAGE